MSTFTRSITCLLASTVLLLAACDKGDAKKGDDKKVDDKKADDKKAVKADVPPVEPKPEPATADVLALGVVKIMEKDKPAEAIELAADGTLKFGPAPDMTLKITIDGKISKPDGTVVAQLGSDGMLSFAGKPSGAVVSETGLTMTGPDGKTGTVKFNEDGSITVDPPSPDALLMVTEGCTGPMVKTCGVIMTMVLLTASEPIEAVDGPAASVEAVAEPKVVEAKAP